MAQKLGAHQYRECSGETGEGIREVSEATARVHAQTLAEKAKVLEEKALAKQARRAKRANMVNSVFHLSFTLSASSPNALTTKKPSLSPPTSTDTTPVSPLSSAKRSTSRNRPSTSSKTVTGLASLFGSRSQPPSSTPQQPWHPLDRLQHLSASIPTSLIARSLLEGDNLVVIDDLGPMDQSSGNDVSTIPLRRPIG